MEKQIDVVVVGAGPVGLLAAIELALDGVSVLVLERLTAPSAVDKALGIGPLGSEALQRRGMAAAIAAAEERAFAAMKQSMPQTGPAARGPGSKFSGHFAGLTLIRRDVQKEPERRFRPVDQHAVEAMLATRASALGIEVRRACDVTALVQQADGVDVEWASPAGAGRIRCSWLAACDGGRSGVRKIAGFDFPGTSPTSTFYNAVVEIDHPERLLPAGWRRTSAGVFSHGFLSGRLVMLDSAAHPTTARRPSRARKSKPYCAASAARTCA
jgi:2-polyprenyl-6-methoxyphenol hydroxylase-like FAD-dependent oxidoreductase